MQKSGEKYISKNYRKEDYLRIGLNESSPENDWDMAVIIFHERIHGRFIEPAIELLKDDNYGFAVMAILTLLIEALAQFRKGLEHTKNCSKKEYTEFLMTVFPTVFTKKDYAERFYDGIRCGILHSAQTQNNTILSTEGTAIRYKENDLYVNINEFLRLVSDYIAQYELDLKNANNAELRKMFVQKMNYVCTRKKEIN